MSGGKDSPSPLNLVYRGRLGTKGAKVSFFCVETALIRPRLYVPEKELVRLPKRVASRQKALLAPAA